MLFNLKLRLKISLFFSLLIHFSTISQGLFKEKKIDSSFLLYNKKYQEVVYSHLNKSTYIKGEALGFTSYVLNKKTKKPSKITTNLYCTISDSDNKIIKKQLIKVENGIATSAFDLDSLFTTGDYTFKAYTNWMLNYNQQNFYLERFKVLDPEKSRFVEKEKNLSTIDAQFLPEGGHIVDGVINTFGVVLKDKNGYGLPNAFGEVLDESNNIITSFKVNELGIGRFSILPKKSKDYSITISFNEKKEVFRFAQKIAPAGIVLKAKWIKDNLIISLVTNTFSLKNIVNKKFRVKIHNGSNISSLNFEFKDKALLTKKVNSKELNSGINILTLFDEDNNPISERLIFNYNGVSILKNSKVQLKEKQDSLSIKLSYKSEKKFAFNNLSTSILPANTKSYFKNNSILAQTLIQPYIKGVIEKSNYYFLNINKKKKYDLDNLLLTQGWSSYNWTEIFNFTPNYSNEFEQGITLTLNNINNDNNILIHRLSNRKSEILSLRKGKKSINSSNFFPNNNESLFLSEVDKKGRLIKPSLYLQFKPNSVPKFSRNSNVLKSKKDTYAYETSYDNSFLNSIDNTQVLDEVAIKVIREKERIEKIKGKSLGKVYFLKKHEKDGLTLAQYINIKGGFVAMDDPSTATFTIRPVIMNTINNGVSVPAMFVNNVQITNLTFFYQYFLENVEYIEIDRLGFSAGARGGAGVIKIFTNYTGFSQRPSKETFRKFDFPITFNNSKKFYIPKYKNYNNAFYKNYGVVDWFPKKQIDKEGNVYLKIKNTTNRYTLFIEGLTDNGEFIFEQKTIELE